MPFNFRGINMTSHLVSIRSPKYAAVLLALLAAPSWGQSRQAAGDAAAKQRDANAAIEDSLAKQRAAIEKQTGQTGAGSFFLLPRAGSLGTVTGSMAVSFPEPPTPQCDP